MCLKFGQLLPLNYYITKSMLYTICIDISEFGNGTTIIEIVLL